MTRAASFMFGILLVAAAVWAQTFALSDAEAGAPLAYTGARGELVQADRFAVRLTGVEAAKAVATEDRSAETDLIFVVATVETTAFREPRTMEPPAWVGGDGKRFAATDKVREKKTSLSDRFIQTGWWTTREHVFEIPPSALADSQVVIATSPMHADFLVEPFPPEAHLDTGLDEPAAEELISRAQPTYVLPTS